MSDKREYKYKDVDIPNIQINQETGYIYSLFIPYKNKNSSKNESVLVIMRNPSEADKTKSDKTINNVLSFCHGKYSGVYLANLYPYYETDSTKLKDFIDLSEYDQKMKKNSKVLESLYKKTNDVIAAWGTNNTGTNALNTIIIMKAS